MAFLLGLTHCQKKMHFRVRSSYRKERMMLMTDNHPSSSHLSSCVRLCAWLAGCLGESARAPFPPTQAGLSFDGSSFTTKIHRGIREEKQRRKKRLIFRRGHSQDQKSVSGEKEETEFVGHRVSSKCSKTGRNWPQIRVFLVAFKMENWLNFG